MYKEFSKHVFIDNPEFCYGAAEITVIVQYRHSSNMFTIYGMIKTPTETGCCEEAEIVEYFPELEPLLQWYGWDETTNYISATLYYLAIGDTNRAEAVSYWGALDGDITAMTKETLLARHPIIVDRFRSVLDVLNKVKNNSNNC